MITILKSIEEWRRYRQALPAGHTLGCVPTLGGLHEGHFALARRSLAENDRTLATLFLNRVQFNNPVDYQTYPANFDEDVAALDALGVDAAFAPEFEAMYPDSYRYKVTESEVSRDLEGAHRPGHFDGVLTIVMKLLSLIAPTRAYFGEKDYQQLQLVRGMAEAFFLPVEIVSCPTIRDADGLALSSRNRKLSPEARQRAAQFPAILRESLTAAEAAERLTAAGFAVEYVEDRNGRRLAAVVIGGVRLIDNMETGSARRSGPGNVGSSLSSSCLQSQLAGMSSSPFS